MEGQNEFKKKYDAYDKNKKILSDIDIWSYLIERVVVNQDGSITFIFNNGKGIKIAG